MPTSQEWVDGFDQRGPLDSVKVGKYRSALPHLRPSRPDSLELSIGADEIDLAVQNDPGMDAYAGTFKGAAVRVELRWGGPPRLLVNGIEATFSPVSRDAYKENPLLVAEFTGSAKFVLNFPSSIGVKPHPVQLQGAVIV